ncbi:MAG: SH3 domain-containing protein [Desulfotalea sp.]
MNIKTTVTLTGLVILSWTIAMPAISQNEQDNVPDYRSLFQPALFAEVKNVAKDDVLNVRIKPDYHSEKVGEIPPGAQVGIDYCLNTSGATWCKTFSPNHIEDFSIGWVNARFLTLEDELKDRGYVEVQGRANACYYAIQCDNKTNDKMCMVADTYTLNLLTNSISAPKTEWISRAKLRASSNFDAAASNAAGYCINGKMINDYILHHTKFLD